MTLPFRNSLKATFLETAPLQPGDAVDVRATRSKDVFAEEVSFTDSILAAPPKL